MAGALQIVRKDSVELKCVSRPDLCYLYVIVVFLSRLHLGPLYPPLISYSRWRLVRKVNSPKVKAFIISYFVFIRIIFKALFESSSLLSFSKRRLYSRCLPRVACCVHNVFKRRTRNLYAYTIEIACLNSLIRLLLAVRAVLCGDTNNLIFLLLR